MFCVVFDSDGDWGGEGGVGHCTLTCMNINNIMMRTKYLHTKTFLERERLP